MNTDVEGAAALEVARTRIAAAFAAHLPRHLERMGWEADRLARFQRDRLRSLLAYAQAHSPFHARRLAGTDFDSFELTDLARLPVMTKLQMLAELDDLVTDRRLSKAMVEDHLSRSTRDASLLLGDYVCLASGGSSGIRGVFVQTVDEYADFAASVVRQPLAALGSALPPDGLVVGVVGAASPIHSSGFGAATASGRPVRLIAAPATLPLAEIVARLNRLQPPALMGYASKLAELAREQQAGRLGISPRSLTSMGEVLEPEVRDLMGASFGVEPQDLFVSTEGLVGRSQPGGSVLTFASDLCIAELVDEDNRPVPDGVASAKVLVTNLHNLTQPLIRYELDDRFVRQADGHGFLRASVTGRADKPFQYGSLSLHPHVIRSVLVGSAAVREYQVWQTKGGIEVAVVADGHLDPEALTQRLKAHLAQAGLANAEVTIQTVDQIARDRNSGKVRRFIALQPASTGSRRLTSE